MPPRFALTVLMVLILLLQPACMLQKLLSPSSGTVQFTGKWPAPATGRLNTKAELEDVAGIEVSLSGEGMTQPQRKQVVQTSPPQETFTIVFESVPLGTKRVEVTLTDGSGKPIAATSTSVVVQGGQTVDAVIKLSLGGPAVIVGPSPTPSPTPVVSVGPVGPTSTPTPAPTVFVVTTLAGDGTAGFLDGPALSAQFNGPLDVGVDGSGNVYVSDNNNLRVRKIDTSGSVSTWAGSGASGTNSGVGTGAQFTSVFHLSVDAGGNLYLSDNNIHQIRKIDPTQSVTTWAGSGGSGTNNGVGVAAQFRFPVGNAVDGSSNVYIADDLNHRIRKIDPAQAVTTFAGSSAGFEDGPAASALFNRPTGVAVDSSGTVYVADHDNNRIRKIAAGVVTTLAGNGTAASVDGTGTAAQFNNPIDIAVDNSGNLYVVEQLSHAVRKITPAGVVTTIAGSTTAGYGDGTGTSARFSTPFGIAVDSNGVIYVADAGNHRIRKIQAMPASQIPAGTVLGTFAVGPGPIGIAIDGSGNAWVANNGGSNVSKLSPTGTPLGTLAVGTNPYAIAIDSSDNVWVVNITSNNVTKLSSTGTNLGTFNVGSSPAGIAIDSSGNAWVTNYGNNNVTKVSPTGTNLGTFNVGSNPIGIAIDSSGNVWVANNVSNNVTKLSSTGTNLGTFTAGAGFSYLAIDSSGNVWVANSGSNSVTELSSTGITLGTFTAGSGPSCIAIDRNNPYVWVANQVSGNVTKLSTGGPVGIL